MYIGLQGMSFLLRDNPGGYINGNVVEILTWQLGPIPVAFIVLVVMVIVNGRLAACAQGQKGYKQNVNGVFHGVVHLCKGN